MAAATTTVDERPTTLTAWIRLCEAHGSIKVRRQDSLVAFNCRPDTDRFIERYCGGRKEVPLKELIPFMRSDHDVWWPVMRAAYMALNRRRVLPSRADRYYDRVFRQIKEPARKRIVDLD